jgi:hypothetical protein
MLVFKGIPFAAPPVCELRCKRHSRRLRGLALRRPTRFRHFSFYSPPHRDHRDVVILAQGLLYGSCDPD